FLWSKQGCALSRGEHPWKHETCWYAVREGKASHWTGDRTQTTVWEIANNNPFGNGQREQSWGHGTQKPVECMRRPIVNNSRPGQAIYDPFLGPGTSLIAAEMTGRICSGVELNPAYVDVVVRRWQVFTGRAAIHQASGQSFDERADSQDRDQSGCAHGRRAFVVNDALRERVRYLAGVGVPQDDIAKIICCAPKTLRKRFPDDLDRGVAEANATMCGYLFAAAKGGNIAAIIFSLKKRACRDRMMSDPIAG